MKNEIIEQVINHVISNGFSSEQIDIVKNSLIIALNGYIVTKDTTELTIYEGNINEELIKKFLIAKRITGRTNRTLKTYREYLIRIFRTMNKSCLDVTTDDIRLYLALKETRDGLAKTSLNNELRIMRTFYQFLQDEEILLVNPTRKIDAIKGNKKKKEAFSEIEVEKIRNACQNNRESALIEILLSTGARVTEVSRMKIDELKGDKIVVHGKGNKDRIVYLNAKAQLKLGGYLSERMDQNPYIFPASVSIAGCPEMRKVKRNWYKNKELVRENRAMDVSSLEKVVRTIGKRAGVPNTHPHRFRRTCATFALRRGMPIEQVSYMLGHEQIATTQIYLDMDERMMEQAHRKYVV